ncbi:MAG: hypothetical protein ABFD44_08275 [Anaerolineaceae bacterium]
MQTCSRCNVQSPDDALYCANCRADLREYSTTAVTLKHFKENPRVSHIRVSVYDDCCPTCRAAQGTYEIDQTPRLPHEGCSHGKGCRCFYEPVLNVLYP